MCQASNIRETAETSRSRYGFVGVDDQLLWGEGGGEEGGLAIEGMIGGHWKI
jgi:hypothetical protein